MNKEETISEFLKGLRIAINTASAYFKEHPYFLKSVDKFKQQMGETFNFLSPIKINVSADSLFIDGRCWEKATFYVELASLFHLRKIKSIEFMEGLTTEELIDFLAKVSLPIKEILRQGGVKNILNREKSAGLVIEELDYSELLRDEGEECKDIWVYLFKEAIEKENLQKINDLVQSFEKIIGKFKTKDLCTDEELRQNLYNFLAFLKDKDKNKFYSCTKILLRSVLKDKNISPEDKLGKLKIFFKDLSKDDLTEVLLYEITADEGFSILSFNVLFQLFDEDTHGQIAPALEEKIKNTESLKTNPKIKKKIKELFSVSESSYILALYRHALYWLSEEIIFEDSFSFDHHQVQINYRTLLLNLLAGEKNKEGLDLLSGCLLKECDKIIQEKDFGYLKFLWEILNKKIREDASVSSVFEELLKRISNFIENTVFQEEDLKGIEYFVDTLNKSSFDFNFYLDKIFNEGKVNRYILKLMLKFFPEDLPYFYESLEKRHSDIELLGKVVESLAGVDLPLAREILKKIFYFSNVIIKIEVLKSMSASSMPDIEFFLSILEKGEKGLKKEALGILVRNDETKKEALERLFAIPSPFGRENKLIIENMTIVEELDLEAAQGYLISFGRRRFFWNRNVRKKAQEVLKNWHDRKD